MKRVYLNPEAARPRPESEPFEGVDKTGFVDRADLADAELSALRRLNPARSRWPELSALEQRIAELEQRRVARSAEVADLETRRRTAPAQDAEALGRWQLAGEQGARPAAVVPVLDSEIARGREDLDGLAAAITAVLDEKARLVAKHRDRLVKDADADVEASRMRVHELVDALVAARAELARCRQDAVWARLYPASSAAHQTPVGQLGGGLRSAQQILGAQVVVDRVFAALRHDADWLAAALTPEQRYELNAIAGGGADDADAAVWVDSPEGERARRSGARAQAKRLAALMRPGTTWED